MLSKSGCCGIATIFLLISIAFYLAFSFPYALFQIKQTETTEIKSVIVIARNGEKSPKLESYFIGEEPPENLYEIGYDELTNIGKERMYLLGKFLRMRYYHLLLNGNPRKLQVRSSDADKCIESAQALLAGLNPPKDSWLWSLSGIAGGVELAETWQPKAIHTTDAEHDQLLAQESNCYAYELEEFKWKNSTRYQQLLNEFRHDLQTLRSNTGLEFEDDLQIVTQIDDSLKTRRAFNELMPAWFTNTFASRLAHIADVTTEDQFRSENMQRLYVGRLLHEIAQTVNLQIKLHQLSLTTAQTSSTEPSVRKVIENELLAELPLSLQDVEQFEQKVKVSKTSLMSKPQPNMFIYLTNKQKLSALMNSLKIYSSQPPFGSLLLIELHYDPINNVHFLRLFSVASTKPSVFPEPLRLNPIACVDAAECDPQQFEQNIRHLMLDPNNWEEACMNKDAPITTTPPTLPLIPINENTNLSMISTTTTTTTNAPELITISELSSDSPAPTSVDQNLEKLDESLIVGPTTSTEGSESYTTSLMTGTFEEIITNPPESTTPNSESTSITAKLETQMDLSDSLSSSPTTTSSTTTTVSPLIEPTGNKDVSIEPLDQTPADFYYNTNNNNEIV